MTQGLDDFQICFSFGLSHRVFAGVGRGARAQKSSLGSKLEICNNNNNNKHSWLRFDFVVFYSNGDILESLVFEAPYARLQTRTQLHGNFVKTTNLYSSPVKIFLFSTRKKNKSFRK